MHCLEEILEAKSDKTEAAWPLTCHAFEEKETNGVVHVWIYKFEFVSDVI